ncbi:hypothetical protein G9A89_023334 [Geosiphon pyriformis]|nr:hypothetical protein G9A89_023334 [Geosiphon pyriformis]
MELAIPLISPVVQIIGDNLKINSATGGSTTSRKREFTANRYQQPLRKETKNLHNNNFKSDNSNRFKNSRVLLQRFNIPDRIETFKKTLYQYIKNCINNYLLGDYNISEVRHNLYESLIHYSRLNTQDFNSQILETYFQELNFNIIQYYKENYPIEQKFSLSFKSETEEEKEKKKQKLRTTPNTPKTTAKHLQTPEQGTSFKLPLSITPFPASLAQPQTLSSPLIRLLRIEDFHKETKSEQETEDSENKEEMVSTYIAKIPEFTEEDNKTSSQKWLDKVSKAEDANGWNAVRMLKAISYFLQGMADEWFENLEAPPEN